MKINKFLPILLGCMISVYSLLNASPNVVVTSSVDFGNINAGSEYFKDISIKNNTGATIEIRSGNIVSSDNIFSLNGLQLGNLGAGNSTTCRVTCKPIQNLDYKAVLFIDFYGSEGYFTIPVSIHAAVNYTETYYNSTFNKKGSDLYYTLQNLIKNHTSFTYSQAREYMWGQIDRKNDQVECVYTGIKVAVTSNYPDLGGLLDQGFNTEHTWPQSKGADNEPQRSDIYHLYPTDETSNSQRSNYPFDNVTQVDWQQSGSKKGRNSQGITVFEPRDEHKGNVARSLFYFATCYGNMSGFLTSQEATMRNWMNVDPVDAAEMARNNAIAALQENRNPYIDHPEFLDRMESVSENGGTFPPDASLVMSSQGVKYDLTCGESSMEFPVYIYNNGNLNDTIMHIGSKQPDASIQIQSFNYPVILPPDSMLAIDIKAYQTGKNVNNTLVINYNQYGQSLDLEMNVNVAGVTLPEIDGDFEPCKNYIATYTSSGWEPGKMKWNVTGGKIEGDSVVADLTVNWTGKDTGSVNIIITTDKGCQLIKREVIGIQNTPAAQINGDIEVHSDNPAVYSTQHDATANYSWSVENGEIISGQDSSSTTVVWDTTGAGKLYLTAKSFITGCESFDTLVVKVSAQPNYKITGDTTACLYQAKWYTTNFNPQLANDLMSNICNIDSISTTGIYVQFNKTGSGYIMMNYKDSTVKINVSVYPIPQLEIVGKKSYCSDEGDISLNVFIPSGGTYSGEGITDNMLNTSALEEGNYSITYHVENENGCAADSTIKIQIMQHPAKPVITQSNDTLYSSAEFGNNWYLEGEVIGDTTFYIVPVNSGTYTVEQVVNGCKSEMSEPAIINSVSEIMNSKLFEVIPDGLVYSCGNCGVADIEIFDYAGDLLGNARLNEGEILKTRSYGHKLLFLKINCSGQYYFIKYINL